MICKDCIKADVCKVAKEFENNPVEGMSIEGCEYFKDKSKFIELPCKVGDTAYIITFSDKKPYCYYTGIVSGIHITDKKSKGQYSKRFDYLVVRFPVTDSLKHINFKDIGKTVFLTKEEAEQALRESENK